MKIGLYLGIPPEGGGAHQYAKTMLLALEQLERGSRLSLTVAYAHPSWHDLVAHHAADRRLQISRGYLDKVWRAAFRFGFPPGILRAALRALPGEHRLLDEAACDLWIFPAQETLACALQSATVSAIHDLMHRYERRFPESGSLIEYWRREQHYQAVCQFSAAILVDSATGKQHVVESYGAAPEKIFQLPYAARQPEPVAPELLSGFLKSIHVPAGRYFYYPAQFWGHKNHVRLIEAFDRIGPEENDLWLILPGSPKNAMDEVRAAAQRTRHSARIIFPGFLEDELVAALYEGALALVMPSFYGPTNIPPLEAMARGCPMALSDVYGMREQSGDAAIYFDPESVDDIARCLGRLHREPELRQTLAANALRTAHACDFEAFTRKLSAILENIEEQAAASSGHRARNSCGHPGK
jgi:glycosyltransferase involved in cell wall biosynthesis